MTVAASQNVSTDHRIAVLGLGYVGCVTAACFARMGYRVIGADRDAYKVREVAEGRAPFYEPGLAEIVRSAVDNGALTATTSVLDAVRDADVAFICVGTPSEKNGNLGLEQLRRAAGELAEACRSRMKRLTVVVRSTVFPGTCEEVVIPALGNGAGVDVVSNPEFLREGSAVQDFLDPTLIVVGADEPRAVETVASLYKPLHVEPCRVSLRTAEMIKYACNAFHALKVSFANEVGALCGKLGVSGAEVMDTLCRDTKLNVSAAYLKPGFAFGGSCLPKDLRALVYRAGRLDMKLPLLESVLPSNQQHLTRAIETVLDYPAQRIAIFGLAFKENTDDLRESPVVSLIEQLIGKGREVRIYDPHIRLDQIYGSNLQFIERSIPHIAKLLATRLDELLGWGECLVISQRPSPGVAGQLEASALPVLDLWSGRVPTPQAAAIAG